MDKLPIDYQRNLMARKILDFMREHSLKLSLAESCTGGLIADAFVSINSASDVFLGGFICYCAKSKIDIANVSEKAAYENNSVNESCAEQFAFSALEKFGSDYSISSTGFAEDGKDIYLCAMSRSQMCILKNNFNGTRNEIRRQAVEKSLSMLWELITKV